MATFLIAVVVFGAMAAVTWRLYRQRKQAKAHGGCSGCGGGCAGCPHSHSGSDRCH